MNCPPLTLEWFRLRSHSGDLRQLDSRSVHSALVSQEGNTLKCTMSDSDSPKKVTKPRPTPTHPPVATMVMETIRTLKDRKGTSLAAIKKNISENYDCDVDKLAPFIRKFLKKAVEEERLVQIKASYKLSAAEKAAKPKKEAKKATKKTSEKVKKSPSKKSAEDKTPKKKKVKKALEAGTPKKKKTPVKKVKKTGEKAVKAEKSKKVMKPVEATKSKKAKSPAKKAVKAKKSTAPMKAKTPKKTAKRPSKQ